MAVIGSNVLCKFFWPCWNSVNLNLTAWNKQILGLLIEKRDSWSENNAGMSTNRAVEGPPELIGDEPGSD